MTEEIETYGQKERERETEREKEKEKAKDTDKDQNKEIPQRQENAKSHGARPVHLIITMIKWIQTSGLSIKNSLSTAAARRRCRILSAAAGSVGSCSASHSPS